MDTCNRAGLERDVFQPEGFNVASRYASGWNPGTDGKPVDLHTVQSCSCFRIRMNVHEIAAIPLLQFDAKPHSV